MSLPVIRDHLPLTCNIGDERKNTIGIGMPPLKLLILTAWFEQNALCSGCRSISGIGTDRHYFRIADFEFNFDAVLHGTRKESDCRKGE